MKEKFPSDSPTMRVTIEHEDALGTRALRRQYDEEHDAAMRAGLEGWRIGNFEEMDKDAEAPIRFLYYKGGGIRGYVEGADLEGWATYGPPLSELEEDRYHKVNTDFLDNLIEAQKMLKEYVDRYDTLYSKGPVL